MTQALNQSDRSLIRSKCHEQRYVRGPTQAPPAAGACPATARADHTWVSERDLQALWAIKLSLQQQWPWARTKALFVYSGANRRTATPRLCAEREVSASSGVSRQLSQATADAQRDLRDQCRASASPRESRLNGSGHYSPRSNQGGRHHRQHDRILSRCRWRYAANRGRSRAC
jgi:hypothetical protein